MKSLVTGGTGFVGRHLVAQLARPVVAGRNPKKIRHLFGEIESRVWNSTGAIDPGLFDGVDAVFHLAGESVAKGRWNTAKKHQIRFSRVESTRQLVAALGRMDRPPRTLVCASAIGYYGDRGAEWLSESASAGTDFLAGVCQEWEQEAARAAEFGVRVVSVRTGMVLGRDGGALQQMLPLFRLGLGGWLGNGRQYLSWIHVQDLVGIMLRAAQDQTLQGPVNGVAPGAVTNRELTRILARVLRRPALLPVPALALRLILGEFASVLLGSQRVRPDKALAAGYVFAFPELKQALADIV